MNGQPLTATTSRRAAPRPMVTVAGVGLVVAGLAAVIVAQYQVNTSANRRVGGEMYGNNASSIRYGSPHAPAPVRTYAGASTANYGGTANYTSGKSSVMLPSELRNAYHRSGALPSDIRSNYAAIGPLAPGGAAAYLPTPPRNPKTYTTGNYVDRRVPAGRPAVSTRATGPTGEMGSVRYGMTPTSTVVTPPARSSANGGSGASAAGTAVAADYEPDAPLVRPTHIDSSVRYGLLQGSSLVSHSSRSTPTTAPKRAGS